MHAETHRKELAQPVGRVLSVKGSQATIGLFVGLPPTNTSEQQDSLTTVGKFLGIQRGASFLVGVISEVSVDVSPLVREDGYRAVAYVDLMGEVEREPTGAARFNRGVTRYPAMGDPATLMNGDELRTVYDIEASASIEVGRLQQDTTVAA